MTNKGKYYITTAIAYTSGKPHIGNTYEIILADAIARFKRAEGYEVYFQTGTDEHGQKIQEKAESAGMEPKALVDEVSADVRRIWDLVGASYDCFMRTTDEDHERCVKKIFQKLYDQGDIYKGSYEGLYCTPCESFWTQSQLIDGKCPDCGRTVRPAKEEAYFFRMSKYADRLIEYINTHPDFIQPVSRKNEMMNNFLLPGLQDLCVSRTSFSWGIPVDFDPKHVVYVWLDALTNYITKIGYDPDKSGEDFSKWWPADLHVIGKDIVRFHTIYWPIFLMALDLPLPKQVFGHPWLLQGGEKMSKSRGNVIYADDVVSLFGVDATRYFVLHEMPFDNDGIITWELVIERYNSDLANVLGNLLSRTISMSNKYFGGTVEATGVEEPVDKDLISVVTGARDRAAERMDSLHVADALSEVFVIFRRCNKYIDETQPWVLARDEKSFGRLRQVLYNLTESLVIGASLLRPYLPQTAQRMLSQLSAPVRDYDLLDRFGLYESGTKVAEKPQVLFARLDPAAVMPKVCALQEAQRAEYAAEQKRFSKEKTAEAPSSNAAAADAAAGAVSDTSASAPVDANRAEETAKGSADLPEISYEDFAKLKLQMGEVLSCEAVQKSKKLLCSKVRVGARVMQIVSGIHKDYTPEEMVGKKVVVLVNLAPAKLAGVVSEGMLLCAEGEDGKLCLLTAERDMPAGSEIS